MIDSLILAQNFSLNLEFHMHMWNYKITMVTEIICGKMIVFSYKTDVDFNLNYKDSSHYIHDNIEPFRYFLTFPLNSKHYNGHTIYVWVTYFEKFEERTTNTPWKSVFWRYNKQNLFKAGTKSTWSISGQPIPISGQLIKRIDNSRCWFLKCVQNKNY